MSRATAETYDRINVLYFIGHSVEKSMDRVVGSSMQVLGNISVEFIKQSNILNRKIGVKVRSEFFPKNKQGGGEWAVLKRYRCSNAYPIIQGESYLA